MRAGKEAERIMYKENICCQLVLPVEHFFTSSAVRLPLSLCQSFHFSAVQCNVVLHSVTRPKDERFYLATANISDTQKHDWIEQNCDVFSAQFRGLKVKPRSLICQQHDKDYQVIEVKFK